MVFVRRALLVILSPLFATLLFATALDFGILHIAGSPAPVEKLLASSGIYKNVIPHALDNVKQSSGDNGEVSLNNTTVKGAAEQALSPQLIQQSTDQIINGVYHWLDGQTALPDFNVDLSGAKTSFATLVGQGAEQRAATLPTCSTGLSGAGSFDPLSATCLPAGLTPAQAGASARDTLLSGKGFLDNPVINADSLKSSGSNQSVFADKQNVPKQFQRAKKTPVILAVLTVLVGTAIVFLSSSRRKGLRHIGVTLLVIGVFMLIFAYVLNWAVGAKVLPKLKIDNAALAGDIKTLINNVVQAVDKNYWLFGAAYAVLGGATIAAPVISDRYRGGHKLAHKKTEAPIDAPAHPEKIQKIQ